MLLIARSVDRVQGRECLDERVESQDTPHHRQIIRVAGKSRPHDQADDSSVESRAPEAKILAHCHSRRNGVGKLGTHLSMIKNIVHGPVNLYLGYLGGPMGAREA